MAAEWFVHTDSRIPPSTVYLSSAFRFATSVTSADASTQHTWCPVRQLTTRATRRARVGSGAVRDVWSWHDFMELVSQYSDLEIALSQAVSKVRDAVQLVHDRVGEVLRALGLHAIVLDSQGHAGRDVAMVWSVREVPALKLAPTMLDGVDCVGLIGVAKSLRGGCPAK